ncbi:MAG TPA: maleylacetoacetate isomerase [Geminicoccaceae bacterium]
MRLFDYWRSSAAYRVRIALNLKGLAYEQVPVDLRAGDQRGAAYLERNPQALVPLLEDGPVRISQSLAIIEYLEERHPEPLLLPEDPAARASARALALLIACEIHPLNNLRVLTYLERDLGLDEERRLAWYRHWIAAGLGALERELQDHKAAFALGERATVVDVCLVPQMANARRYACDLEPYPTLRVIDEHCRSVPAFAAAAPERQPDAPGT